MLFFQLHLIVFHLLWEYFDMWYIYSSCVARCEDVKFTVPKSCVGAMYVSGCQARNGSPQSDGTIVFSTEPQQKESEILNKKMERNPIYFVFNQGEVRWKYLFFIAILVYINSGYTCVLFLSTSECNRSYLMCW